MKFICPSCKAENQTSTPGAGCGLCGYGKKMPEPPKQQTEAVCHECRQATSACQGRHYLRG